VCVIRALAGIWEVMFREAVGRQKQHEMPSWVPILSPTHNGTLLSGFLLAIRFHKSRMVLASAAVFPSRLLSPILVHKSAHNYT